MLNKYLEPLMKKTFEINGAFWAFSEEQFKEQYKEGVKYGRVWGNCFVPKENATRFIDSLELDKEEAKEMMFKNHTDE